MPSPEQIAAWQKLMQREKMKSAETKLHEIMAILDEPEPNYLNGLQAMMNKMRQQDLGGAFDEAYELAEALDAKLTRIEHTLVIQRGRRDALREDARRREFTV